MSRIKKALEKAKAHGVQIGSDGISSNIDVNDAVADEHRIVSPRYKKTKIVKVPINTFIENKIVSVDEDHPVADQFKLLRTRILQATRQSGLNTIQVSGFDAREGKSVVALNLAISMAKDMRQTTLLVDVDFRRPSIHKLLGLPDNTFGLKQYFEQKLALEDIFINPGIDKLTILPAGGKIPNATEVIGAQEMEALVKELKGRYPDRYIIFDSPGLNTCPDPLVFLEYVDGLILVARADVTTVESIENAIKLVPHDKLLGTVLNDLRWQQPLAYHERY